MHCTGHVLINDVKQVAAQGTLSSSSDYQGTDCFLSKMIMMISTERSSKSSHHPGGGRIQDPRGPLGLFATTLRLLSYLVLIN